MRRQRQDTALAVRAALYLVVIGVALYLTREADQLDWQAWVRAWEGTGGEPAHVLPADAEGPCRLRHAVDGDTAILRCGAEDLKVRLLRIDTPELDEAGYREAGHALREWLSGRDVHLVFEEPGVRARGNYGRLLAYLYVGNTNVNVEMVRAGHSRFDTRWGAGRFEGAFLRAEREARGG